MPADSADIKLLMLVSHPDRVPPLSVALPMMNCGFCFPHHLGAYSIAF
jgi:hypothetical protein